MGRDRDALRCLHVRTLRRGVGHLNVRKSLTRDAPEGCEVKIEVVHRDQRGTFCERADDVRDDLRAKFRGRKERVRGASGSHGDTSTKVRAARSARAERGLRRGRRRET